MRGRALWIVSIALLVAACGMGCGKLTERRLAGQWESEATPKRTLTLRGDGSYQQRFSGKTLGVLSELLGPEAGSWRVSEGALVLERADGSGEVTTRRLPIEQLSRESCRLAGERWLRLP